MGSASNYDYSRSLALDGSGNIYIAGESEATWGTPINPYAGGGGDTFVAKFNSNGALLWNTFMGSAISYDYGKSIAVDDSGNVYVAGSSWSTWGTPVNSFAGKTDAFAAKLDSSGALLWNTFMGSWNYDNGNSIAVDGSGNVYLAGQSDAWGTPVNPHAGSTDAFAAKLDSNGALSWNTFMGSASDDYGNSLAVDSSANVYVAGQSYATWGKPVNPNSGGIDVFVAKIGPDFDGDGMDDNWEMDHFGDLSHGDTVDSDSDGLTDLEEFENGTDPNNQDTDADGLTDEDEVIIYATDPLSSDSDGDGINDDVDLCPNDPNNDADADGICGNLDNCPTVENSGQEDDDADGFGNACDPVIFWNKTYGENLTGATNGAWAIVVDSANNTIVTGQIYNKHGDTNGMDIVLIKYSPNGKVIWEQTYDSGHDDEGEDIVIDSADNIIIMINNYLEPGYQQTVIKYDLNGNIISPTIVHPVTSNYYSGGLALDSDDNIIVCGYYQFSKYDSDGNPLWTGPKSNSFWVPEWSESATIDTWGVATDSSDNIILTGRIYRTVYNSAGPTTYQYYATAKYDSNGNFLWGKVDGNTDQHPENAGIDVAVDSNDNIITAGIHGTADAKYYSTVKYDSDGNILWKANLGNGLKSVAYGVSVDSVDNIYVTGFVGDSGNYAFNIKYTPDGSVLWSDIYYQAELKPRDIALHHFNEIVITGAIDDNGIDKGYFTINYALDKDVDGMPDWWEDVNGLDFSINDSGSDPDGDILSNIAEYEYGTDPNNSDSDSDGLNDFDEINTYETDPVNPDTDGDNLSDYDEVNDGTNPLNPDSDNDGIKDDIDTCPNDPNNDYDADGLCGDVDNCPVEANTGQEDDDGDGVGNVCDNCLTIANPDQEDEWITNGPYGTEITDIAASPTYTSDGTIFATTWTGLYKSTDHGQSWIRIKTFDGYGYAVAISPDYPNDRTIFVNHFDMANGYEVYRSNNGGQSWSSTGVPVNATSLAISPNYTDDQTLITAGSNGVAISIDGGATWTLKNLGLTNLNVYSIAISPNFGEDDTIFIGTANAIFKSENKGESWSPVFSYSSDYPESIRISPNYASDQTIFIGIRGDGVFRSTDGGTSWTNITIFYTKSLAISPNFLTDSTLFIGTVKDGVFKSTDGGNSWNAVNDGLPNATSVQSLFISPDFSSDQTVFAGFGINGDGPGIFKSTNGGTTWYDANTGIYIQRYMHSLAFSDNFIFVGTETGDVFKSDINDISWSKIGNGIGGYRIAISPNYGNDQTIFVSAKNTPGYFISRSTDGGNLWQQVFNKSADDFAFSPNFAADQTIFAVSSSVYKSTDGGSSWTALTDDLYISQIEISPNYGNDQTIFAAGSSGVFKSVDDGNNWTNISSDLPKNYIAYRH